MLNKLLNIQKPEISEELKELIEISVNKRAKRLYLKLDYKKKIVRLVVPPNISAKRAGEFAFENEAWIRKKISEIPKNIDFSHGQKIPVFGKELIINIDYNSSYKRTSVDLCDKYINVSTNKDNPSGRIERFLKEIAGQKLTKLAKEKACKSNKIIKSIQLRDTKSRWGSCSNDGRINFSWRLIFAPYEAMDYVVAHEVAHLTYMNHSKLFWQLCENLSCDYVYGKAWMQKNGNTLMRYGY